MSQLNPAYGTPQSLILDLLHWLEPGPRSYPETMDAWRTSCPRLTIWEDAIDAGYIARERRSDEVVVVLTPAGRECLRSSPWRDG